MTKRVTKWILLAAVVVCCVFAGNEILTKAENGKENTIADGVFIGNISVGGMTEEEATAAINDYAQSVNQAVFTLTANGKDVKVTAEELGITLKNTQAVQEAMAVGKTGNLIKRYKDSKDLEHGGKVFELPLSVNETAATEVLTQKAKTLNNEAVNNGLTRVNGQFQLIEGSSGVEVNIAKSVEEIENLLRK